MSDHDASAFQTTIGPRLVRVDLRELRGDHTLALTPTGAAFEIASPAAVVREALLLCDGTRSALEVAAQTGLTDGFEEIVDVLAAQGCITDLPHAPGEEHCLRFGRRPAAPRPLRVALAGDAALVEAAREHVADDGVELLPTCSDDPGALAGVEEAVLVVLRDRLDVGYLTEVDERCAAAGVAWVPFHFDRESAWLGPAIGADVGLRYRDVLDRRRCAMLEESLFEALASDTLAPRGYLPPARELRWMLAVAFVEIERWRSGGTSALLGNEIELEPRAFAVIPHPVLPRPDAPGAAHYRNTSTSGAALLLDERTGLIASLSQITHPPVIPRVLTTVVARVSDTLRLAPWAINPVCGGSLLYGTPERVGQSAIGEGVERYCGNWVQADRLRRASHAQLCAAGEDALDPRAMVLYSDAQYDAPGFPFVRFDADLPVQWIRGRSLTRDVGAWVPASFAYVNWHVAEFVDEPPTNFPLYPGIAAGPTLDDAICAGLEELIERHATMVWWANLPALPSIELPHRLAAVWEGEPERLGQRGSLLSLPNRLGVPVVAGIVENVEEQLLSIGFAARADPLEAALKAWSEGLTNQEISRDLLREHGLFRDAVRLGLKSGGFIKPWRSDRAYLDDFRGDFRDVGDLECQPQVYLDPRAIERVRPWLQPCGTITCDDLPVLAERSADHYRALVEHAGLEVFCVDLTTPDVAASGLRVVRIVVPGLVPNFPAAFPFLGRRRLQDEAVELGWRERPLGEHELNLFPLAHA